ncbi:MAG: hypothetical protein QOF10_5525 [Kribbellaceae bacterium]|nr:hypothetical protein [Kribbellaceae bacterium]
MKKVLEHLSKLSGRIKLAEDIAAPHKRRGRHEPEATTKKGFAGRLVRNGIPALVIGSVAAAGFRRRRAKHQGH